MNDCTSGNSLAVPTLADKYVELSKEQEVTLCKLLGKSWRLVPAVNTFQGLKLALRERLSSIAQIARKETVLPIEQLDERLRPRE